MENNLFQLTETLPKLSFSASQFLQLSGITLYKRSTFSIAGIDSAVASWPSFLISNKILCS